MPHVLVVRLTTRDYIRYWPISRFKSNCNMPEILDQPMADGVDDEPHLRLTEEEDRVLALYDKLQELRLEIAIINAQRALQVAAVGQERRPDDGKHALTA